VTTFTYTGAVQQYVVPDGVYLLAVTVRGARGQSGANTPIGTLGYGGISAAPAQVTGVLAVTPGETLQVYVGGSGAVGGWNGGGAPGAGNSSCGAGGRGGGASDIRQGGTGLAARKIVAAGSAGGGGGSGGHDGGAGGAAGASGSGSVPGTAGTQVAGGTTGGAAAAGGVGAAPGGGGGGGGYYGGGGGAGGGAFLGGSGGGGGSSYTGGVTSGVVSAAGTGSDDGSVTITPLNTPPAAPTLVSMASGETVDIHVTNRATHIHSDINGDPQAAFDIRYRLVGDPTWTTVNVATTAQWYDFPADSLTAGAWERQVRTYDTADVGPWSPSGYFTAAESPGAPTIISPADGATIIEQHTTVDWSTGSQEAYQVRRVADDGAGEPDTDVIYFDSGEVTSVSLRSLMLDFETNHRTEHVQVRVKDDSLWSSWTSVAVDIDYDIPPVPSYALAGDTATGSLLVTVTNPAPGAGELDTDHNDIYIDDGQGEERKATAVAVDGTWRYWTPVSGRDYTGHVRVVAVAANGTTASSS